MHIFKIALTVFCLSTATTEASVDSLWQNNTNPAAEFLAPLPIEDTIAIYWSSVKWEKTEGANYTKWKRLIRVGDRLRVCVASYTQDGQLHFAFNEGSIWNIDHRKPQMNFVWSTQIQQSYWGPVTTRIGIIELVEGDWKWWEAYTNICGEGQQVPYLKKDNLPYPPW